MFSKITDAKFIKFLIIGIGNTSFTYLLYVLLIYLGIYYQIALLLDYIIGVILGYFLNKHWTFSDRRSLNKSFRKYVVTYIALYGANVVLLEIMVVYFDIGILLSQFVAFSFIILVSFTLQNSWVFRLVLAKY